MKTTVYRYIFREIWPTLLTSLLVFVFVVLAAKMLKISEWIINQGVQALEVIKMILFLLPSIMLFALPAATLMAVLVAFLRLSGDNEILALKSSGVSLYQMLPPVLGVSLITYLTAALIGLFGSPWGNRSFRDMVLRIAQSRVDLGLKERIFCEPFSDVTLFVNSLSARDKTMHDVFLVDRREPLMTSTIVAKEGRIIKRPGSRMVTVHFVDGTIFTVERKNQEARTIRFSTYDLNIDLSDIVPPEASRKRSPKEMGFHDLLEKMRDGRETASRFRETAMELMERFSIPLAVFLMGLIGVPLGAQVRSGGRLLGICLSMIVFLAYYLCLAGARSLGETGVLSPVWGPWIPDVFLLASALWLVRRAGKERSIAMLDRIIPGQGG